MPTIRMLIELTIDQTMLGATAEAQAWTLTHLFSQDAGVLLVQANAQGDMLGAVRVVVPPQIPSIHGEEDDAI